ncbi:MAG TPA: glycosyltransferase family 39 protein [Gemmatimonadaceae bacterium]|nr:glycosyltransferase family 39 protein [Gemmatimonadaceae bacterium]
MTRHRRALWAILGSSLILKLVLAVVANGNAAVLDEVAYLGIAKTIVAEGRYETTFRPPLYPGFIAAFLALGLGTLGVRVAQALLGTVSAWLAWRIGRRTVGERAGVVAAAIVAFDPVLVAFSHRLWSETLFIALLLAAIDLLTADPRGRRLWRWGAAGVLLGLASLARPMLATFIPFILPWALLQAVRGEWRSTEDGGAYGPPPGGARAPLLLAGVGRFALLGALCAAMILPWTFRNARATGAFILIDSNGPYNILVGAQPEARFVVKDDMWSARFGRVGGESYTDLVDVDAARAQQLAMRDATRLIAEEPAAFVGKSLWEAGHLWTLDSFLLRHLRNGWYGPGVPRWAVALITLVSVAFFVGLVIAGAIGFATGGASPFRGLALLLIAHSLLLFSLTYALSRYRLPLHPLLAIPAAAVLLDVRGRLAMLRRGALPARRRLALAGTLALLALAWVRDLPMMWDMVAHGGAGHRYRFERLSTPDRDRAAKPAGRAGEVGP